MNERALKWPACMATCRELQGSLSFGPFCMEVSCEIRTDENKVVPAGGPDEPGSGLPVCRRCARAGHSIARHVDALPSGGNEMPSECDGVSSDSDSLSVGTHAVSQGADAVPGDCDEVSPGTRDAVPRGGDEVPGEGDGVPADGDQVPAYGDEVPGG